jgi:hypothetical protein
MKAYLDCIPCFFRQALESARIAGASEKMQRQILNEVARILFKLPLTSSPAEMGRLVYRLVKKHTRVEDAYVEIKRKSNRLALSIYERLREKVEKSSPRLLMAVELAIAGNVIDYGVKNSLNVNKELERILVEERKVIKTRNNALFDYVHFQRALDRAKTILYLADNAGETVFDRILIEEIKKRDKEKTIVYAVRGKPVINDALEEDAYISGIDKSAKILSSGSDAPGTILSRCTKNFLKIFKKADLIISKGQGNFEALSSVDGRIFFLLVAKCPVIARDVGCKVGDVILLSHFEQKAKG